MQLPPEFFGKSMRDLIKDALDFNFEEFDPPKHKKQQIYPNIQTSVCQSQKCEKFHKLAKDFCNINCRLDEKSRRMINEYRNSKSKA